MKTKYTIDPFIFNSNFENRRLLVKMRISDHNLGIETGRYNKINREQRICKHCNKNEIDDEEHFFLSCSKNEPIRKDFFKENINKVYPSGGVINKNDLVTKVLSISTLMQTVAPFIKKSLELRRVDSQNA